MSQDNEPLLTATLGGGEPPAGPWYASKFVGVQDEKLYCEFMATLPETRQNILARRLESFAKIVDKPVSRVTQADVDAWAKLMGNDTRGTVNQRLSSIKKFLLYAIGKGACTADWVAGMRTKAGYVSKVKVVAHATNPKAVKPSGGRLSLKQIRDVAWWIENPEANRPQRYRDAAILAILWGSQVEQCDIESLICRHLSNNGTVYFLWIKRLHKHVQIPARVAELIRTYWARIHGSATPAGEIPMFVLHRDVTRSRRYPPVDSGAVNSLVYTLRKGTQVPDWVDTAVLRESVQALTEQGTDVWRHIFKFKDACLKPQRRASPVVPVAAYEDPEPPAPMPVLPVLPVLPVAAVAPAGSNGFDRNLFTELLLAEREISEATGPGAASAKARIGALVNKMLAKAGGTP